MYSTVGFRFWGWDPNAGGRRGFFVGGGSYLGAGGCRGFFVGGCRSLSGGWYFFSYCSCQSCNGNRRYCLVHTCIVRTHQECISLQHHKHVHKYLASTHQIQLQHSHWACPPPQSNCTCTARYAPPQGSESLGAILTRLLHVHSYMDMILYILHTIPWNPNSLHITCASFMSQSISQRVPHSPLWKSSTIPSEGASPPTNWTAPSLPGSWVSG